MWAVVQADGALVIDGATTGSARRGSIHSLAREILGKAVNGWTQWYYWDEQEQKRKKIDEIRKQYRHDAGEE